MRKKKLLNLSAIIIGALLCFGFNKVQAIDSVFDGTSITRNNLQSVATSNALSTPDTSTVLGISKTRKTGNYYSWENNTTVDAKNVWKIADYTSGSADYSDLYYCLNAERGFGATQGRMAEGATDTYITEYEVNDTNKSSIIGVAGGSLGTNYNKVLWILDNLYIPTGNTSYKTTSTYKNFKTKTGMEYDLTEEQIEVVQQMAIWYFTNNSYEDPNNNRGELPNLYYNGTQTSNITLTVDDYGERITLYDELNDLYKYFINGADSYYTHKVPTLTLSNASATVTESGDYFVAGPFNLSGTNTELISEITATVTPNKTYKLLNSNNINDIVTGNNFKNVIGNNFYLRFNKSDITSDTTFNLKLNYKYNIRNLTVMTDITDVTNTQPVVLVEPGERRKEIETNINIQLKGSYDLVLVKEDENGEDLNSTAKFEVNGQEKTVTGRLTVADDVQITSQNVGTQDVYTIKELVPPDNYCKFDGIITVRVTKSVSNGKYIASNVQYTVTGGNASDVNVYLKNGNIYVEVINHPFEEGKYDLVLVKEDENGEDLNSTAKFEVNGQEKTVTGRLTVADDVQITSQNVGTADVYTIKETVAPDDYCKFDGTITVTVTKKVENGKYVVDGVNYTVTNGNREAVNVYLKDGNIYVEVKDYPFEEGQYDLVLVKEDEKGEQLNSSATFEVNGISKTVTGRLTVADDVQITSQNVGTADVYTIKETVAPDDYCKFDGTITVTVTKKVENGKYVVDGVNYTVTNGNREDVNVYLKDGNIYVEVKDYPFEEGQYDLVLVKEDEKGEQLNSRATFEVNGVSKTVTGRLTVADDVQITSQNVGTADVYTIKETVAPDDYCKFDGTITVTVTKKVENGKYVVDGVNYTVTNGNREDVNVYLKDGNIYVEVKDYPFEEGQYDLVLVKEDEKGEQLNSRATFEVNGISKTVTGRLTVADDVQITSQNVGTADVYTIKETVAPDDYCKFDGTITVTVTKKVENEKYVVDGVNYTVTNGNREDVNVYLENGNIYVKVKDYPEEKPAKPDLALRKYITKIGSTDIANRIPQISDPNNNLNGDDAANHTAIYKHPKNVLEVKKGDMVEYSITIYNEGQVAARASKITDQIPAGLKFINVVSGNYELESYDETTNRLVLKETSANSDLGVFENINTIKSTTVVVKCEVLNSAEENKNLVNIAWISEMKKENETFTDDIDSQTTTSPECNKNSNEYTRPDNNGYFPGQQDDDDFDRIKVIPVEEGKLKIKLLKVDESNNKIESSEAKFDIKEGNNTENKTTTSGEIDLGQKTITGDNFEYTYTIKETQAPVGYELVNDELSIKINGTTKKQNNKYIIDTITIKDKNGNDLDNTKITANYDNSSNTVIIRVKDKKIENEYSVRLLKTNKDGTQALDNAWFKISTTNDLTNVQTNKISVSGETLTTGKLSNTNPISLTYYLKETQAPEGYIKDETLKEVKIKADVELNNGKYELRNVRLDPTVDGIELVEDNNVITIKVKNNPEVITGKYKVVVKKVDSTTGEVIPVSKGATFKINNRTYTLGEDEIENTNITSANDIRLQYTIEETQAPTGYDKIEGTKTVKGTLKIVKDGTNWKVNRLENVETDNNITMVQDSNNSNTIIIKVKDNPTKKNFDLALRKFITAVNKEELKNADGTYTRAPKVDTSTIATTGTATYRHTKYPVSVQKGDVVTYTLRVYNEGELDGYVNKIADYLPNYLLPIIEGVEGIDSTKYAEEITFNADRLWALGNNNRVETEITNKEKQTAINMYGENGLLLTKFEEGKELDYIDVQIKCLVKNDKDLTAGKYLTNIAEIVDAEDINGEHWDGKDSTLNNVDVTDIDTYKDNEALASNTNSYIKGQEDDDDFEKLILESFDLSLRKFITRIGNTEYNRAPEVDTSKLGTKDESGKVITTATYNHPKDPLNVKKGDIITYTLRVYNEGTLQGYATEIFDYIPEGLEFIENTESSINQTYGWKLKDGKLVSTYLADKLIKGVKEENESKVLDYKDVQIQLKVTADPKEYAGEIITNWAEIGEDSNNDIDSTPGNEIKTEDDIDYEPVKLVYFDLALRKFITNANGIEYNNRIPEVDTSKLGTLDENGKKITSFTYKHTKEPVVVTTGSTVIYTIRVYNEGSISGYATEITDNIPEGLQFLPEDKINTDYKWKMLDAEGNVTEDTTKAKKITTTYLANDIIDSYQKENGTELVSFKDVKVAFKVIEPNTSNRLVINTAEISKASDEDIDSTPGNNDLTEDDIDREYLKVKYFDLALKKWVTETRVTYNGKTTVKKTGFNENSTDMAKVDLVSSRLKKTTVKFAYNIKIINEGEVAGYATQVEDYIPAGLKFVQADNPKWKLIKDDVAVTDQLKDTLLEPGQSATIEIVLTWKNETSNMGVKTNWAEIKEDSDDDVDSVPDNYKKEEDDIDNAKVILSIKTGSVRTYILLGLISITILAGGTFLIKKYVISE